MTTTAPTVEAGPQFAALTLAASTPSGPLIFHASTTGLNRYGFSLRSDGWLLSRYRTAPTVLWMHDPTRPPIGRANASAHPLGGLLAAVTFDQGDPFAVDVERKYREGFLHAVSVGFGFVNADGSPFTGPLTAKALAEEVFYDLEEISAVPVPADPGALRELSRLGRSAVADDLASLLEHPPVDLAAATALLDAISPAAVPGDGVDPAAARALLDAIKLPDPARRAMAPADQAARQLLDAIRLADPKRSP